MATPSFFIGLVFLITFMIYGIFFVRTKALRIAVGVISVCAVLVFVWVAGTLKLQNTLVIQSFAYKAAEKNPICAESLRQGVLRYQQSWINFLLSKPTLIKIDTATYYNPVCQTVFIQLEKQTAGHIIFVVK